MKLKKVPKLNVIHIKVCRCLGKVVVDQLMDLFKEDEKNATVIRGMDSIRLQKQGKCQSYTLFKLSGEKITSPSMKLQKRVMERSLRKCTIIEEN